MKANLHLHSKYSDGLFWPEELVAKSREHLDLIGLTDHDTFAGISEFLNTCSKIAGIEGIAGVEIDCTAKDFDYDKELLAYFPEYDDAKPSNTQKLLQNSQKNRTIKMKHYIKKAKQEFDTERIGFQDYLNFRKGNHSYRDDILSFSHMKPNLFNYLKHKNIIDSNMNYETFKNTHHVFRDLQLEIPTVKNVIQAVSKDNGFVVIPHLAHEFGNDNLKKFIAKKEEVISFLRYCKSLGASGIEIYYYKNKYRNQLNAKIKAVASQLQYDILTFGSDYHGHHSEDTLNFSGDFKGFK